MANNFKYSGKRITLAPTVPVAAGTLCRVLGFVGVPLNNAVAGESVAFALEGVWGMTVAVQGVVPPIGTVLYWDTSVGALSIGAANDDYPAVKPVTLPSSTGAFDGLLLPQGMPYGQEQS
jgi:predicted RecA/RadA family phage recombinase